MSRLLRSPDTPRWLRLRALSTVALLGLLGFLVTGCGSEPEAGSKPDRPQVRGVILISLDTLRADRLGAYTPEVDTSPFFDSLAAQGVLFERAYVQLPGTLPSHMTLFTGLYPEEHGVYPPDGVLASEIPTLPEVFQLEGYRTAGFSEGGYTAGRYGFDRGFEVYEDHWQSAGKDRIDVFHRGLEFIEELGDQESFFLFLHTYAAHDPYFPPKGYRDLYLSPGEEAPFEPSGPNLVEVNRGKRDLSPEGLATLKRLYDAGIRFVDDQLAELVGRLEQLGPLSDWVIVVTSDHGEEFLEHGRMVHEQIYPETLHVPLLVLAPGVQKGLRVKEVVESVDVASSLYELTGVAPPARLSGHSLVDLMTGRRDSEPAVAYSEAYGSDDRSLIFGSDQTLEFVARRQPSAGPAGTWMERKMSFDHVGSELVLGFDAYHAARQITVFIDGEPARSVAVPAKERESITLRMDDSRLRKVSLEADSCDSPAEVEPVGSKNTDQRCLSVRVHADSLATLEFFDLSSDPLAQVDLSARASERMEALLERLNAYEFVPLAEASSQELTPELEKQLESLGYLQ